MRNYVTNFMFMLNGPGSVTEKTTKLWTGVDAILHATNSGLYASDCLVTWAKSMGFLEDAKFVNAINGRLNGNNSHDDAIKGTIWRAHVMCWVAQQCLSVDGDYVEAACYAGDTARLIIDYIDFYKEKRTYWLYDLFENDGTTSEILSGHTVNLYEETQSKFTEFSNVRIIKGRIPESFKQGAPEKIALLHIDMNNAPSERATLEALYDRVQPGGILIFDDYGWVQYRTQKDVADEFMGRRGKRILELPTGQGMVIR